MTTLQCPTRVLVVRHADAEYETDLVSDEGGSLTPTGRRASHELGALLRGHRLSRVWTSPLARAVQTAEIVASEAGVDVVVREGLREYDPGDLAGGGELIDDVVARVARVLEEVADQHRGECVLVVSHGGAILATLPQLVGLPRSAGLDIELPHCGLVELVADADGWSLVSGLEA